MDEKTQHIVAPQNATVCEQRRVPSHLFQPFDVSVYVADCEVGFYFDQHRHVAVLQVHVDLKMDAVFLVPNLDIEWDHDTALEVRWEEGIEESMEKRDKQLLALIDQEYTVEDLKRELSARA